MNIEQRIERQISAMSEVEKRELLDRHIGAVLPGHDADPEADAEYLKGVVADQLRKHDERVEAIEKSGIALLERRVQSLEAILGRGGAKLIGVIAKSVGQVVNEAVADTIRSAGFMRHRGTWVEDHDYTKGDCVTTEGATWLALADPPTGARPGKALEWRLIAK